MSATKGILWANRMELSRVDAGVIESWFGSWVSRGSQVSSKSSAFLSSSIGSLIVLHLVGPFAPLKLSLSEMTSDNAPFQVIWVVDWIAACADRCCSM